MELTTKFGHYSKLPKKQTAPQIFKSISKPYLDRDLIFQMKAFPCLKIWSSHKVAAVGIHLESDSCARIIETISTKTGGMLVLKIEMLERT